MARYMYIESFKETVAAGHSKHVFTDRVPSGHVLHVMNCYAHCPACEVNDVVRIYVRSGGRDSLVRSRKVRTENLGLSALNEFSAGEGDQVFAYFPDSDNTDSIELHINGFMIPTKEWRDLTE